MLTANEGHTVLKWKGEGPYTLLKTSEPNSNLGKELYKGLEDGFFITGLPDGKHFFTLLTDSGEKAFVTVNVKYPEKGLVIFSLIVGSFLFISLCLIIYLGNKEYA